METFYEVTLYAEITVVVPAKSEEEAKDIAEAQTSCGDYRFDESEADLIDEKDLDFAKKHADLVFFT